MKVFSNNLFFFFVGVLIELNDRDILSIQLKIFRALNFDLSVYYNKERIYLLLITYSQIFICSQLLIITYIETSLKVTNDFFINKPNYLLKVSILHPSSSACDNVGPSFLTLLLLCLNYLTFLWLSSTVFLLNRLVTPSTCHSHLAH